MANEVARRREIGVTGRMSTWSSRQLNRLEERTILRAAGVQGEGLVQSAKVQEIDHLAREAMSGQAMLQHWGSTLAAGDPFVSDDMKFFMDLAKLGKGEVLADTIDTFCRESRR